MKDVHYKELYNSCRDFLIKLRDMINSDPYMKLTDIEEKEIEEKVKSVIEKYALTGIDNYQVVRGAKNMDEIEKNARNYIKACKLESNLIKLCNDYNKRGSLDLFRYLVDWAVLDVDKDKSFEEAIIRQIEDRSSKEKIDASAFIINLFSNNNPEDFIKNFLGEKTAKKIINYQEVIMKKALDAMKFQNIFSEMREKESSIENYLGLFRRY